MIYINISNFVNTLMQDMMMYRGPSPNLSKLTAINYKFSDDFRE